MTKYQAADDVRDHVVEDEVWAEWFAYKIIKILWTSIRAKESQISGAQTDLITCGNNFNTNMSTCYILIGQLPQAIELRFTLPLAKIVRDLFDWPWKREPKQVCLQMIVE